jgi:hypothetical protein
MKDFYDSHVAGIDKTASDDKAREVITEAVVEMFPRQVARKKLDIAKDIRVAWQLLSFTCMVNKSVQYNFFP